MAAPWVEKFRPRTIDDVAHQREVVETLRNTLATGNLPHLLFYGPPGTGKTSTILAVAKQLFGAEAMKTRVLELNASDERGIDVVRKKIKVFASLTVAESSKLPPFKIIILDEADSMTSDAQHALRRTMELYTKVTRFCIICNYVSRIIEPIASRCAKFRFRSLPVGVMTERLTYIAKQESLTIDDGAVTALVTVSGGDMRRAVMLMQTCYGFYGKELTAVNVLEAAAIVPVGVIKQFFDACRSGIFDQVQAAVADMLSNGFAALQVVAQLSTYLTNDVKDITDVCKARACIKLAEADACLQGGADETLQLLDVGGTLLTIFGE